MPFSFGRYQVLEFVPYRICGGAIANPVRVLCAFVEVVEDVLQLRVRQPTLQLAASAYLRHGEEWGQFLSSDAKPVELVEAIAAVLPQLDRQMIRRAVADHSNDFSIYPVDSLLRSSVCRLSARHSWPVDNGEFHTEWQAMTGDQQSAWTVLTLAAGTNCYMAASSQDESAHPEV